MLVMAQFLSRASAFFYYAELPLSGSEARLLLGVYLNKGKRPVFSDFNKTTAGTQQAQTIL